jgi:hypothetical protein
MRNSRIIEGRTEVMQLAESMRTREKGKNMQIDEVAEK